MGWRTLLFIALTPPARTQVERVAQSVRGSPVGLVKAVGAKARAVVSLAAPAGPKSSQAGGASTAPVLPTRPGRARGARACRSALRLAAAISLSGCLVIMLQLASQQKLARLVTYTTPKTRTCARQHTASCATSK